MTSETPSDKEDTSKQIGSIFRAFESVIARNSCGDSEHERYHVHSAALNSSRERYQLWVGSLGGHHPSSDPRSLQTRLRYAPQVERRVLELLTALERDLGGVYMHFSLLSSLLRGSLHVIALVNGDRSNPRSTPCERNPIFSEEAELAALFGLADEEETDCGDSALCDDISHDVGRLIKICMLIRRSTARDRYARAEASTGGKFDHAYDVCHVKEKHRRSTAPLWLLERLGRAITKRRQYLRYVRDYRSRIAHVDAEQDKIATAPKLTVTPSQPLTAPSSQIELPQRPSTIISHSVTMPSLMPTSVSTMRPTQYLEVERSLEDNQNVTTTATSVVSEISENTLHVPDLALLAQPNEPFPCPYCPTIQAFRSQARGCKCPSLSEHSPNVY